MINICKPISDNPNLDYCEGGWLVPGGWIFCEHENSARCPAIKGEKLEQLKREHLKKAGFGEKYQTPIEARLFDCRAEAQNAIDGIKDFWNNITTHMKRGEGYLLCGTVGTGKTFALALTALKAHWPQDKVKHIHAPALFDLLHTNKDVDEYRECDLLLLDDMGAAYATPWNASQFNAFFEYRYANLLSTCITSNQSVKELSQDKLFERVIDRWRDTCGEHVYGVAFPSLRGG